MRKYKFYKQLYFQVTVSILIGVALGHLYPQLAIKMKPLGDGLIKLIRMLIAPIIFTTVVTGISSMKSMKDVGRIGLKSLVYFEVMTTLALIIGLLVANIYQPGSGLNIDPHSLNSKNITNYSNQTESMNLVNFLLNIIPDTLVGAFAKGDILPVLLVSILFGFALINTGEKGKPVIALLEHFSSLLFCVLGYIMKAAPIGAFGAMAYTIGTYGLGSLLALSKLLACVYITSLLFIFIVLGLVAKFSKFSLWKFLKYIKEELLIVLGTSSSESVLPQLTTKMEKLGCQKTIVGLVLPTGYSFNLDGTSIYLTIAVIFIAEALNINLTFAQQLSIIAILLLTSKGAATVSGGGFIVLAATLSTVHIIPVEGVVLLLGIDRFMSEARALTNLIGNGVATIVIAKWEGAFDSALAKKLLDGDESKIALRATASLEVD